MTVVLMGCVPVVADSGPRSYNISAEDISLMITERTRAIIVTHIAGKLVDMDPVMEPAKAHNIHTIEDCSQAHIAFPPVPATKTVFRLFNSYKGTILHGLKS